MLLEPKTPILLSSLEMGSKKSPAENFLYLHASGERAALADEFLGKPLDSMALLKSGETDRTGGSTVILLCIDPAAPGVLSDFRTQGQAIRFGADPMEVLNNPPVRAEFETLVERLCFRHKLAFIYYQDEAFAPLLAHAADLLGLELTTWQDSEI